MEGEQKGSVAEEGDRVSLKDVWIKNFPSKRNDQYKCF
jgi:hypothetical protein